MKNNIYTLETQQGYCSKYKDVLISNSLQNCVDRMIERTTGEYSHKSHRIKDRIGNLIYQYNSGR